MGIRNQSGSPFSGKAVAISPKEKVFQLDQTDQVNLDFGGKIQNEPYVGMV